MYFNFNFNFDSKNEITDALHLMMKSLCKSSPPAVDKNKKATRPMKMGRIARGATQITRKMRVTLESVRGLTPRLVAECSGSGKRLTHIRSHLPRTLCKERDEYSSVITILLYTKRQEISRGNAIIFSFCEKFAPKATIKPDYRHHCGDKDGYMHGQRGICSGENIKRYPKRTVKERKQS